MYIFAAIKLHFPEKRAALLQIAGIDNFIKPKMSTGSFGTKEKCNEYRILRNLKGNQKRVPGLPGSKGNKKMYRAFRQLMKKTEKNRCNERKTGTGEAGIKNHNF